jgi:hypothetical protein
MMKLTDKQREEVWSAVYRATHEGKYTKDEFFQELDRIISSPKEPDAKCTCGAHQHPADTMVASHFREYPLEKVAPEPEAPYQIWDGPDADRLMGAFAMSRDKAGKTKLEVGVDGIECFCPGPGHAGDCIHYHH